MMAANLITYIGQRAPGSVMEFSVRLNRGPDGQTVGRILDATVDVHSECEELEAKTDRPSVTVRFSPSTSDAKIRRTLTTVADKLFEAGFMTAKPNSLPNITRR